MSARVEQRVCGTRSRRGRDSVGVRGNTTSIEGGDHAFATTITKQEISIMKSEEQESSLTVARHTRIFRPPVNTDWNDPALCRFFSDYTMDTNNLKINPGFLHNLSRLFNEATAQNELLVKAVRAVSLANFSNQSRTDHFLIKSRKAYGESLTLLKIALSDGNLTSVSTLAGVLLLNMYDVRLSSPNRRRW